MTKEGGAVEKFEFVDVLRGLAVLMVIVVHHGQKFQAIGNAYYVIAFGQMGVQLFFLASAFTLCHSWSSRGGGEGAYRDFLIRRFFRIAPLYYLAIPLYYVLYRYVKHDGFAVYTPLNVGLNLAFLQSFREEAMNGIVPGGWSIGVEMLFYLIFPALFGLISGWVQAGRWALVWALPVAVTALCTLVWLTLPVDKELMYYGLPNQLPVFLTGMAAYFAVRAGWKPVPRRDAAGAAGLGALAYLLFLGTYLAPFPRLCLALLPLAAALSFACVLSLARRYATTAPARVIARIGQVSFSIYIFHFIFAWPVSQRLVGYAGGTPTAGLLLYFPTLLMTIVASYGVAVISKHVIEDRANAMGRRVIAHLRQGGTANALSA